MGVSPSLFRGVWHNYIIPLTQKATEYGDNKAILLEEKLEKIEEDKKAEENKIKLQLARKRAEAIANNVKGARKIDIEEEYLKLRPLERLTQEKIKMIDDESNYNPIMEQYLDEIHNEHGGGLIDRIISRKNRNAKNVDLNVLIEEYGKVPNKLNH